MKKLLCALPLLLFVYLSSGQATDRNYIEFGVDLSTPLIWAVGGDRDYSEVEFIYRESQRDRDLRFKVGVSNYNYFGQKLIVNRRLMSSDTAILEQERVEYLPKTSYLLSLGFSKNLPKRQLPIYYGVDFNLGLSRGTAVADRLMVANGEEEVKSRSWTENSALVVGLTPLLGVKWDISEQILFGVEFGYAMNTTMGRMKYRDIDGQLINNRFSFFDFGVDRLINDIVLLVKI